MVGRTHRVFVVLDDEKRVADVAQVFEDLDQPRVVARMKADARFVENVERADEQRAEIRRELDALRFAARKRRGEAAERQIIETDIDQEFQTPADLEQELFRDLFALFARASVLQKMRVRR